QGPPLVCSQRHSLLLSSVASSMTWRIGARYKKRKCVQLSFKEFGAVAKLTITDCYLHYAETLPDLARDHGPSLGCLREARVQPALLPSCYYVRTNRVRIATGVFSEAKVCWGFSCTALSSGPLRFS